ncbi:MAG: hemin uptake protein HemP [Pseudomonadota bacterium]
MAGHGELDVRRQPQANPSLLPRVPVSELMGGGREAVLVHDSTEYRLRLTSNGKLILTK